MGLSMLESGKMISNKVTVNKNGKMALSIRVNIIMAKNKEKECLYGETTAHIKDSFGKIISMGRESMYGKMAEFIRANGTQIRCMEKVFSYGQMVVNIRGSMKTIKSMDLEFLHLKMEEYIKASGAMENSMEEGCIRKRGS